MAIRLLYAVFPPVVDEIPSPGGPSGDNFQLTNGVFPTISQSGGVERQSSGSRDKDGTLQDLTPCMADPPDSREIELRRDDEGDGIRQEGQSGSDK